MEGRLEPEYLRDPSVERWLRYKEEGTKKYYPGVLARFLENLTGPTLGLKDPASLIAWAKGRPDNLEVQDLIEKFGEAQPETTRLQRMSALRSFYKRNGVGLPSMASGRQVLKNFHRGYKREEVQAILGYLDSPAQKLYVLFGKDTGLRANDLFSLRYRHVEKDLKAGEQFVHLYLEPRFYNRRKASGRTFIGPETIRALKKLVEKGKIGTEPDSRIFPFPYQTIVSAIKRARKKAELDPLIQPSHGLRKFFEACLDRVGMDHHKKLQLEGHSQGVRIHYTDRDIDELRGLYSQAYQYLDLSEEAAADNRVKGLEELVVKQQKQIDDLEKYKGVETEVLRRLERLENQGKTRETVPIPESDFVQLREYANKFGLTTSEFADRILMAYVMAFEKNPDRVIAEIREAMKKEKEAED
jgi:integrase